MSKLSSGRRSHQEKRPERSKVFIFVEGLTEWHYFNGFKRDSRGSGIALEIPKTTLGRSGLRLVQESINYLEYHGKEDGDSVFVVFDRDSQFGGYAVTDANLVQLKPTFLYKHKPTKDAEIREN